MGVRFYFRSRGPKKLGVQFSLFLGSNKFGDNNFIFEVEYLGSKKNWGSKKKLGSIFFILGPKK